MPENLNRRGMVVTAAGTGINLALGVLYTWSIFKGAILLSIERGGAGAFTWDAAAVNDPYAVCVLVFACSMVLAGRCQDRFGPRVTALISGALVGPGFVWISQSANYWVWVSGFGVLVGAGIAFGYSAATPAALKWYPPNRTGSITGIVVSGFGLASVYIAPLATWMLIGWGLSGAMLFFGIAFFLVVSLLALLLVRPPPGFTPAGFVERRQRIEARDAIEDADVPPSRMLRRPLFWLLWILYFIGAGAGLMVIGSIAGMAKHSLAEQAFVAVALLAVGNAAGRIVAGTLSDRIGRKNTLGGVLFVQALLMFGAIPVVATGSQAVLLVLVMVGIGFNYGANLALFPAFSKDLWGIKNFGVNYGLLFTAWGIGGFVLSRISEVLKTTTGGFTASFVVAGVLLVAGASMVLLIHDPKCEARRRVAKDRGASPPIGAGHSPA
jgi:nitrate/nitrite transporter NarK